MLKIFLAEDEIVVRESIRKNINWEEQGYTFVGEAGDGEIAYSMILEKKPDVIISDIKMPFMDGLELCRLVREDMPWVKIIFLTGYDEFAYAKQAISLGASEYLLKPVSSSVLIETIGRIRENIEAEQKQTAFLERYQQEMMELERLQQQKFFENLVSGEYAVPELLQMAGHLGLPLSAQSYNILLFNLSREQDNEIYSEDLVRVMSRVEALVARCEHTLLFKLGLDGWAILAKGDDTQDAAQTSRLFAQQLEQVLGKPENVHHFIAVGKPVQRLGDIRKSYQAADRAFAYRFIQDSDNTVYSEQTAKEDAAGDVSLRTLNSHAIDTAIIERLLRSGERGASAALIDEVFASIGEAHMQSLLLRQYIAMNAHFSAVAFLEQLGIPRDALLEKYGAVDEVGEALETLQGSKEYIVNLLEHALQLRDELSHKRYSLLLHQAQMFIRENHGRDDISLNLVARHVNMSPTHFSTIFSQEMGSTFIEYLTSVRMEQAKELLRCSRQKTAEIAYNVGYKDPHYFSYLFKKLQGCTPREFRAAGKDSV